MCPGRHRHGLWPPCELLVAGTPAHLLLLHSGGMPLSPDPTHLEIQKPCDSVDTQPLQQQCGPCKTGQSLPTWPAPSWGSSQAQGKDGSPLGPTRQGSCKKSPHFCVRFETASKCQVRLLTLVLISTLDSLKLGDAKGFPIKKRNRLLRPGLQRCWFNDNEAEKLHQK